MKPCRNPDCSLNNTSTGRTLVMTYCTIEGCHNAADGRICDQHAYEKKVCAHCLKSRKDRHKDRNK